MTPEQERDVIDGAVSEIEAELSGAYAQMLEMIQAGDAPRAAVAAVMAGFAGAMEATMRAAFLDLLAGAAGAPSDVPIIVGPITLSARLYAEATATGEVVHGIVQRHASGFQDARRLALELFEGYGFREPGAEPLQMRPGNLRLPLYLREALLADPGMQGEIERAFAKLQASNLATPALRAAYSELLSALDGLEDGPAGGALLQRKLDVAFYERMRYFATRIARTELHRAYARRETLLILADVDVEFVQILRAPGRDQPCICVLITGRDLYGLGPGVYPKREAPVPGFHPFCMCVMAPRLDLTGRTAKARDDAGDAYFLSRVGEGAAGRIMGSKARAWEVVERGRTAEEVTNAGRNPQYRLQRAGELAPAGLV